MTGERVVDQESGDMTEETLAQQKERLRRQCRAYRNGIGQSRRIVRANLGRDALAKNALGLLSARAQNVFANAADLVSLTGLSGIKLQSVLPVVLSGISLLSRRSLFKPILRGSAFVGAIGASLYFFAKRKKDKTSSQPD